MSTLSPEYALERKEFQIQDRVSFFTFPAFFPAAGKSFPTRFTSARGLLTPRAA
jgi:hypothetical protein